MSRFGRITTKAAIVGGSIYGTKELGVWGDETEKVYAAVYNFVAPFVNDIPVEIPELPKVTNITSTVKNYWNYGVLATGQFILHLPENANKWSNDAYNFISTQFATPDENS